MDCTINAYHVLIKTKLFIKRYRTHYRLSDLDTFGTDSIFVNYVYPWGKSSAVIFYWINKTRFVSFVMYMRQSRDRFRMLIRINVRCLLSNTVQIIMAGTKRLYDLDNYNLVRISNPIPRQKTTQANQTFFIYASIWASLMF